MKMRKNRFWICVFFLLWTAFPGLQQEAGAAGKIMIRITHEVAQKSDLQQVFEEFAKNLEKEMPGRFDIRIYPLGQLFKDKESFDQIRMGNVEMGGGTMGTLAAVIEQRLAILDMPFLFSSFEKMRGVMDSELGKELSKIVELKGLKLLGIGRSTRLGLVTKDSLMRTPKDIEGKLIRGFAPTIHQPMLEAWGARFTYLAAPELAHAMETGIIDGIWTSALGWVMSGREPGRFFTIFPPHAALMYKVCSVEWWNKLPKDVKPVIEKSMQKALDLNWVKISPEYEKENLDNFPCGSGKYQACHLTKEEVKLWKEKSKSVYEKLQPLFGKDLLELALKFSGSD